MRFAMVYETALLSEAPNKLSLVMQLIINVLPVKIIKIITIRVQKISDILYKSANHLLQFPFKDASREIFLQLNFKFH